MIGAIVGDVVGSRFEWDNHKSKDFELFDGRCRPTDDSIMSLAVAQAILRSSENYEDLSQNVIASMQELGRLYPDAGYGGSFFKWIFSDDPQPYNSYGNGSAMRVSPCGYAARSLDEAKALAVLVTQVSHNHPEGMKGAEAIAVAIFLAREGKTKEEIREYVQENYYAIDFTIDEIRESYEFDVSCQGSVPVALATFFESTDFEDAIRNAISVGGDSDTIAAIVGSVAEAFYGAPEELAAAVTAYLDARQLDILRQFEQKFPSKTRW
ncbi:MAG: ADP-ribosylglycohydrolase family protein [Actinomycetaceae bacterium]|nr:ADP-ribosylglycohydrolase family protein [Actinomycetaceae bacterium]